MERHHEFLRSSKNPCASPLSTKHSSRIALPASSFLTASSRFGGGFAASALATAGAGVVAPPSVLAPPAGLAAAGLVASSTFSSSFFLKASFMSLTPFQTAFGSDFHVAELTSGDSPVKVLIHFHSAAGSCGFFLGAMSTALPVPCSERVPRM